MSLAAIPISKTDPVDQPLSEMSVEQLADHVGDLDLAVQRFEPSRKRYEAAKVQLKARYDGLDPEQTATAYGTRWEVQIGAKAKERKWISIAKVSKAVGGIKRFYELCTVAIGAVEDEIGKSNTSGLLIEAPTGSRRLKAVLRAAPKAA